MNEGTIWGFWAIQWAELEILLDRSEGPTSWPDLAYLSYYCIRKVGNSKSPTL
jgi:hypothetical protein